MEATKTLSCAELYEEIYKGCKMGGESIVNLLPKVNDEGMKTELTRQLGRYDELAAKARTALLDMGKTPAEEGIITRLSAKMGVAMNTMVDATSSHVAQMIMEGCTMGVTDLIKNLHLHGDESNAAALAREVVDFEEDCYERMKAFL